MSFKSDEIRSIELKSFFGTLLPAVFLVILAEGFNKTIPEWIHTGKVTGVIGFILVVVFSLALPIIFRVSFAGKQGSAMKTKYTAYRKYLRIQNRCLAISVYLLLLLSLLKADHFYLLSSGLIILYSLYRNFPGRQKLESEIRIFRVDLNQ